jgi:hypothetical protein
MKKNFSSAQQSQSGQGIVEYVAILLLVGLISYLGAHLLGVTGADPYQKISDVFSGKAVVSPNDAINPSDTVEPSATIDPSLTPEPTETTYVEDDLENMDNWKKINGSNCWDTHHHGSIHTTKGKCNSVLMNNALLPQDYKMTMNLAQLIKGDGYGLMFRLSKEKSGFSGYSFQVDPGYGDKFVFRRYDANGAELGTPLAVASFPAGFDPNAPHNVSVSVVGDTFTAYVDGVQVLTAQDDTYTSGGTGLRTWGNSESDFSGYKVTSN